MRLPRRAALGSEARLVTWQAVIAALVQFHVGVDDAIVIRDNDLVAVFAPHCAVESPVEVLGCVLLVTTPMEKPE